MKELKNIVFWSLLIISVFVQTPLVMAQTVPSKSSNLPPNQWNPQKTWVFFAGLVEWNNSTWGRYEQKNRRDEILVNLLRERGVPENQIVYLKDSEATQANIEKSFAEFLRRPKAGDWVFVYYCGHGYKTEPDGKAYFAPYDSDGSEVGWEMASVPATIEKNFKGSHAILVADNCYSGALIEAVKNGKWRANYAVFASSSASQISTGNWTFTEGLISAFRGAAYIDDDQNGKVTFAEAQSNAAEDMLFAEEQVATFAFTGNFSPETVIAAAKPSVNAKIGERVEVFTANNWYKAFIKDFQNNLFRVHYYGYFDDKEELVKTEQIRASRPKQYKVGDKVEVEWKKEWYPAGILAVRGGAHLITYDGYDKEWDEWVSSKRIRQKP
ncbi:MAG: agenet domain-containing protein [Pyrinomonadaceae bacterium]